MALKFGKAPVLSLPVWVKISFIADPDVAKWVETRNPLREAIWSSPMFFACLLDNLLLNFIANLRLHYFRNIGHTDLVVGRWWGGAGAAACARALAASSSACWMSSAASSFVKTPRCTSRLIRLIVTFWEGAAGVGPAAGGGKGDAGPEGPADVAVWLFAAASS